MIMMIRLNSRNVFPLLTLLCIASVCIITCTGQESEECKFSASGFVNGTGLTGHYQCQFTTDGELVRKLLLFIGWANAE